jgi:hypothetical protein
MKYYNINNNKNFTTDDFSDLFEFEYINGNNLLEKIQKSYDSIEKYITKKTVKNDILSSTYSVNSRSDKVYHFSVNDGTKYYTADDVDTFPHLLFSTKHKTKYNYVSNFTNTLTPESEFKNISTKGNYLFFHLPSEFILDNLTRTLTNTDIQKFKEFSAEFIKSKNNRLSDTVRLIEKYDEKFDETLKYQGTAKHKHSEFRKWRADFDINFYMSLYHYGFFNPIVNDDDMRILWGGTHRAAYGASLGYDVPNFMYFTENEKKEEKFYRVSPPVFNDRCGIFEFDLNKKEISIKLIPKKDLTDYVNCVDDGCDIQGFNVKVDRFAIKRLFELEDGLLYCKIDFSNNTNNYYLNKTRYIDDSVRSELINFNIYNDFQLLNIFKNRNENLYELKWLTKVNDFIGEFGSPISLTYPIKNKKYHQGDYLYIEIPYGIYKDFVHGWTDDVCTKYFFSKENQNCNCYTCKPENKSHLTLKEVREYIRKSKYWKNKKNTTSSSYKSFLSLKYLGVQRPIVNLSTFLQRGVHRSLFLSETNSDVPNLFKIDISKDINTFISAKPYFKLKEYLLLDIDIKNKELSIYTSIDTKTRKKLLTKISYK